MYWCLRFLLDLVVLETGMVMIDTCCPRLRFWFGLVVYKAVMCACVAGKRNVGLYSTL